MFLQKETYSKNSLALGPQGPKQYIFGDHFYSKNVKKLRLHVFLLFHFRKHMTSSFCLKWPEFTRNCEFCSNCGFPGHRVKLKQFTISCEYDPLQVKWYHIFSSIKMEEYMEPELSGIFWVKMVVKNIVLGSPGTHFIHIKFKRNSIANVFLWILFAKWLRETKKIMLNGAGINWNEKYVILYIVTSCYLDQASITWWLRCL